MTDHCAACGHPTDHTETHHVDHQRGHNHPDNLSPRCRHCHHDGAHDNPRAVADHSRQRFGPPTPDTSGPDGGRGGVTSPVTQPPYNH